MRKFPKTDKAIIKRMEKAGCVHVGTVPDVTTREGQVLESQLDAKVKEMGGTIHNVRIRNKCWVFSGPNPLGSRSTYKLPRHKEGYVDAVA
jgi:hypothetical protein